MTVYIGVLGNWHKIYDSGFGKYKAMVFEQYNSVIPYCSNHKFDSGCTWMSALCAIQCALAVTEHYYQYTENVLLSGVFLS